MNRASEIPEEEEAVRLGRDLHYGLAIYEKNGQVWAVGSGAEFDLAVALFIKEELTSCSIKELLERYQPMADPSALIQAHPLDVLDTLLERLVRWAVQREPGRYLGGPHAASKPRIAVFEGLPSSFAIRLD
jgi:hypothetical protein